MTGWTTVYCTEVPRPGCAVSMMYFSWTNAAEWITGESDSRIWATGRRNLSYGYEQKGEPPLKTEKRTGRRCTTPRRAIEWRGAEQILKVASVKYNKPVCSTIEEHMIPYDFKQK